MSFALEEARHERHVEGTAISPPRLGPKKDDSDDRMEKTIGGEQNIFEFQDDAQKAVAGIGKIFNDTVQKGCRSVKELKEWTP